MPRRNGQVPAKSLISRGLMRVPNGPAFAPVGADPFVLVRNTVPRIVPIAPAEIRPAAPAPQSKDAGDPFEQLLQATGRDDQQPDEPHTRGMESTSARPVDYDRNSARRTDRRDDAEHADQHDDKTDHAQADDSGKVAAKDKSASADDSSAD